MINRSEKIVFIGNPRSCTTSLHNLLSPKGFDFSYWHDPLDYYINSLPNYNEYQYFMIVRNPYDRFVSWWSQHRRHNHKFIMKYANFSEWVKSGEYHDWPFHTDGDPRPVIRNYWIDNSPLRQKDFIQNDEGIEVNILKFESINEDWKNIFCKKTNVFAEDVEMPLTNATTHEPYLDYYDDTLKEMVYNYAREDFEFFGYNK